MCDSFKLQSIDDLRTRVPRIVAELPYLRLLLLFGSRATGKSHDQSDWDFAVLYDEEWQKECTKAGWAWMHICSTLQGELHLPDHQMDLVILNCCSPVMAHTIARDALLIYESGSGEFDRFRMNSLMSKADQKAYIAEKRNEIRAALLRWEI